MGSRLRDGWGVANVYCYPYTTGMRGECEPGAVFACAIFLYGYINAERDMLCRLLYDYTTLCERWSGTSQLYKIYETERE